MEKVFVNFFVFQAMQSDTESDNTVSTDDDNYDDDDKHFPSTLQGKKVNKAYKTVVQVPNSNFVF